MSEPKQLPVTVSELIDAFGGEAFGGDPTTQIIRGFADLTAAGRSDLAFYNHARYRTEMEHSLAGAVVVGEEDANKRPAGMVVVVNNPRTWFARVLNTYGHEREHYPGVHETASVDASVILGAGVHVGAGAVIAKNARIGNRTQVRARAIVTEGCHIGSGCILHEGCLIGGEGFGFYEVEQKQTRMRHLGRVVIADDVEIGSNTCIDRGLLIDTVIGKGTKIDNLVQIGHNVRVGENAVICGLVGIGGSAIIGDRVWLGGQVGVPDHTEIVADVKVMGGSTIMGSIRKEGTYGGLIPSMSVDALRRVWKQLLRMGAKPASDDDK